VAINPIRSFLFAVDGKSLTPIEALWMKDKMFAQTRVRLRFGQGWRDRNCQRVYVNDLKNSTVYSVFGNDGQTLSLMGVRDGECRRVWIEQRRGHSGNTLAKH